MMNGKLCSKCYLGIKGDLRCHNPNHGIETQSTPPNESVEVAAEAKYRNSLDSGETFSEHELAFYTDYALAGAAYQKAQSEKEIAYLNAELREAMRGAANVLKELSAANEKLREAKNSIELSITAIEAMSTTQKNSGLGLLSSLLVPTTLKKLREALATFPAEKGEL